MARAFANCVALMLVLGLCCCGATHARSDDIEALNERISELEGAGKYAEAIPLAEKTLGLARAHKGEDSPYTAEECDCWRGCTKTKAAIARPSPS